MQGQVLVTGADEDTVFEAAIEAGADDVQPVLDDEGNPTNDFRVRRLAALAWAAAAAACLARGRRSRIGWLPAHETALL